MKEEQFQVLVKMIKSLDQKVGGLDQKVGGLDQKVEAFKAYVDKEFEQIDRRLEWVAESIKDLKEEIKGVKHDVIADRDKLQEVHESRDKVTVSFTRAWATASFFIALISSTIILAVAKAF